MDHQGICHTGIGNPESPEIQYRPFGSVNFKVRVAPGPQRRPAREHGAYDTVVELDRQCRRIFSLEPYIRTHGIGQWGEDLIRRATS